MGATFDCGIYPGGMAGSDTGILTGVPDDLDAAVAALAELQGDAPRLIVRCYDSFQDEGSTLWNNPSAPRDFVRYAAPPQRPMDLVLQYRSASADVAGYLDFVRRRIDDYAPLLYSVQITEEANFVEGPPVIDGPYPEVARALVEGVRAAKRRLAEVGRPDVKVGFSATPTFGANAEFWTRIAGVEPDYAGLDFFPDVFAPVAAEKLASTVVAVLETMRGAWMPAAGLDASIPIHICEHGWPTPAGRTYVRQAEVIEEVIRTIHADRERLNVARYTHFALRDVALPGPQNETDLFSFFGILRANYERKPAFDTYRRLIAELAV